MLTQLEFGTDLSVGVVNNESCTEKLSDCVVIELYLNLGFVDEKHECGRLCGR